MKPELTVRVSRSRIRRVLVAALIVILVIHLYVLLTDDLNLVGETLWRRLSNVMVENTLPTWLSGALMAVSAALFWLIASWGASSWRWRLLAIGFLVMSIDEVASLHETMIRPLREAMDLGGLFYYAWVLPALGLVAGLGVVYARFVWDLPPEIRWRTILAGSLFVLGAVGLEMFGGIVVSTEGGENAAYYALSTAEETLELSALILLVDTLLLHLGSLTRRTAIMMEA